MKEFEFRVCNYFTVFIAVFKTKCLQSISGEPIANLEVQKLISLIFKPHLKNHKEVGESESKLWKFFVLLPVSLRLTFG